MARIEFVISRLENKTTDQWDQQTKALRSQYQNQVEDGSGDYSTSVTQGITTSEQYLKDTYSPNASNPDVYDLLADWDSYVDDNLSQEKWRVHGLVLDWFAMDLYDMSDAGGVAYSGSAASEFRPGGTFWSYNDRGTVHEATHAMTDTTHWDHNLGREDGGGDTTAMGASRDRGCSYLEQFSQSDLESGTTKLGFETVNAIREYRDNETYLTDRDDCCYGSDENPCNPP